MGIGGFEDVFLNTLLKFLYTRLLSRSSYWTFHAIDLASWIIDAIWNEIKEDNILRAQIKRKIGSGEVYHFVNNLIKQTPKIVVVMDKKLPS